MIKKNLDQWLSYLESIHPTEIELGLNRIRLVAERMDLLKPAEKIIVVAGTNGKGSTVTYCDHILRAAGQSVGCYMSPHLHHLRNSRRSDCRRPSLVHTPLQQAILELKS